MTKEDPTYRLINSALIIFSIVCTVVGLSLLAYAKLYLKPEAYRLQRQEFYILGCAQAGLNKAKCKSNYKRFIQQAQDN